jgi:hypothetical protein
MSLDRVILCLMYMNRPLNKHVLHFTLAPGFVHRESFYALVLHNATAAAGRRTVQHMNLV